jgi:hypothetical protein
MLPQRCFNQCAQADSIFLRKLLGLLKDLRVECEIHGLLVSVLFWSCHFSFVVLVPIRASPAFQ